MGARDIHRVVGRIEQFWSTSYDGMCFCRWVFLMLFYNNFVGLIFLLLGLVQTIESMRLVGWDLT